MGLGEENYLGPFLVGDFIADNFMGSLFACLVVGIFTNNAYVSTKDTLSVVA